MGGKGLGWWVMYESFMKVWCSR